MTTNEAPPALPQVLICTPVMHGFEPHHVQSLMNAFAGVQCADIRWRMLVGCPMIAVARAQLVHEFRMSEWGTHLLFLDADVVFRPTAIERAVAADKDIIGVPYPFKSYVHREEMRAAAARGEPHWEEAGLQFTIGIRKDRPLAVENGVASCDHLGGGFLLIKRAAIERMAAAYPELLEHTDVINVDGQGNIQAVPPTSALFKQLTVDGQALPEDFSLCHRWRHCHERDGGTPGEIHFLVDEHMEHHAGGRGWGGSWLTSMIARGRIGTPAPNAAKTAAE